LEFDVGTRLRRTQENRANPQNSARRSGTGTGFRCAWNPVLEQAGGV